MSLPYTEQASQSRSFNLLLAVALLGVTVGVLFFWLPYSAGYFDKLESLASLMVYTIKSTRGEWEHCYLVPVAVAAILYFRRREVLAAPVRPFAPGAVLLLGGAGVFYFGRLADIIVIGYFGFQIILMGAVLTLFGRAVFSRVFFALLFLAFAWPLPFLEAPLAFPLRMVMSEVASNILNIIGISTLKVGTSVVSAPDPILRIPAGHAFAVDVADPCSGIRSLFALTMISALYAYFAVKPLWKQIAVFLCAVPLAIAGNLARILMLTFGTVAFGAEFAIGKDALEHPSAYHMIAGYVVFAVALLGLVAIGSLLQGDWRQWGGRFREHVTSRAAGEDKPASDQTIPSADLY